jgi:predicted Zn-dependent protease
MSPLTNFSLARVYLEAGHFDEAITQARRTQELSRHHPESYQVLVRAYTLKGLIPEANAALKEWEQHFPGATMQTILRANLLARSGDVPKARALIREWLKHKAPGRRIPGGMAFALAATGDTSDAFNVINEDITRHVLGITWLKCTPELVPVRSDARFTAALVRMHLH